MTECATELKQVAAELDRQGSLAPFLKSASIERNEDFPYEYLAASGLWRRVVGSA